jgi:hypothetical protein
MQRVSIGSAGLEGLAAFVRGAVTFLRGFAVAALLGVAAIAAVLARGGFEAVDVAVTAVLLAPPAILLFFAAGLRQILRLPERLRRMPSQGSEQLSELRRIAGAARSGGFRRAPSLLWRLRGVVGSSRDLVGFALPLRVFTPGFLGLTALAAFFSLILIGAGTIALIVLALG